MNLSPQSNSNYKMEQASFTAAKQSTRPLIKNIPKSEAIDLSSLVDSQPGRVTSCTLAQNKYLNITVFAFAQGEGLSTHHSSGDAMVQVLTGCGNLSIDGQVHRVNAGQSIVLPANIPHAVDAPEDFKMLLTVVKPIAVGA